jgi:SH3 domain protein
VVPDESFRLGTLAAWCSKMKTLIIAMLLMTNSGAYAEISKDKLYYITDHVQIPMRSDKAFDKNIVRFLSSGEKLSILQTTDDGWTQVKFEDSTGWLVSRYITDRPSARSKLKQKALLSKVLTLNNRKLRSDIKALQDKYNKLVADGECNVK